MKIDIGAFDGMDELDAVGPLEVLRRGGFDVRLVTLEPVDSITCAGGLRVIPDGTCRDEAEMLILPGGGWNARSEAGTRAEVAGRRWESRIHATAARGAILGSVCTGAMILAAAGVLANRRATTHHGAIADLEASGAIVQHDRVVDDGNLITAGGVTSGIDLGLWIVRRFAGREQADRIAEELEYRHDGQAC